MDAVEQELSDLKKRKQRQRGHEFKDSPYYDIDLFKRKFAMSKNYALADAEWYYEQVKNWAESGGKDGKTKLKQDWMKTAFNFALGDKEKGKLRTIADRSIQDGIDNVFSQSGRS